MVLSQVSYKIVPGDKFRIWEIRNILWIILVWTLKFCNDDVTNINQSLSQQNSVMYSYNTDL